ncbi:MAG: hypothetical protein FD172_3451 [Methylocystaceae bacterium]|nr:MAG: hypothetical protein FD172_3451 [Methylocystaceae bacterium]
MVGEAKIAASTRPIHSRQRIACGRSDSSGSNSRPLPCSDVRRCGRARISCCASVSLRDAFIHRMSAILSSQSVEPKICAASKFAHGAKFVESIEEPPCGAIRKPRRFRGARRRNAIIRQQKIDNARRLFRALNAAAFRERGIMLGKRIADADQAVGGLSEEQRLTAQHACPLIEGELCLAYKIRPLACRGHAAISTPHLVVRSLVQNALMAALRRAGLAWGLYEVNRALNCALSAPHALEQWMSGEDPLTNARILDFDLIEAGAILDAAATA